MIWFMIAACGIALDQLTKWWAAATLSAGAVQALIPGFIDFRYHVNTGAAWSFLAGHSWGIHLLSLVSLLASILFAIGIIRLKDRRIRFCLALILGGAVGNLLDRTFRQGVIDFISVSFGDYYFPIFNVADMLLVIGLVLAIVFLLFTDSKKLLSSDVKK